MQLIFDSATDTDVETNMAFIDKESVHEIFASDGIIEKLCNNDTLKSNKEYIDKLGNVVVNNAKETEKEGSINTDTKGLNNEHKDLNSKKKGESYNHNLESGENDELKDLQSKDHSKLENGNENKTINNLDSESIQQNEDTATHSSGDAILAENNIIESNLLDKTTSGKQVLHMIKIDKELTSEENSSYKKSNNIEIKMTTDKQMHSEMENNDSINSEKIHENLVIKDDLKHEARAFVVSETIKIQEKDLENINNELIPEEIETIEGIGNIEDNLQKPQENMLEFKVLESKISEVTKNSPCTKPDKTNINVVFSTEQDSLVAQNELQDISKKIIENKAEAYAAKNNTSLIEKDSITNETNVNVVLSIEQDSLVAQNELQDISKKIVEDKAEACAEKNNTSSIEKDSIANEICVQDIDLESSKKSMNTCNNDKQESDLPKDGSKIIQSDETVKSEDITKKNIEISTSNNTNTIEINDDSSQEIDVSSKIEHEKSKTGFLNLEKKDKNIVKSIDACNTDENTSISLVQKMETERVPEKPTEKSLDSSEIQPIEKIEEPKKISLISKLSNTLDILSDDEVITEYKNTSKIDIQESNKQCINIEDDDDDIMLIDDEGTSKGSVLENTSSVDITKEKQEIIEENKFASEDKLEKSVDSTPTIEKDITTSTENSEKSSKTDTAIKQNTDKVTTSPKPLLPTNFVSTCKKNLAEMTRNDLEEFCILKIVESVVDRGNLGEIKSQLKKMALCVEEHKNKAKMLTKQNQDLQVVLRSVQEELRNNSPITPLKITRSVGIQVLMSDKSKRKPLTTQQNNPAPVAVNKPQRSPATPNNRPQKQSTSPQQIPVPRLVLAKNVPNSTVQNQAPNSKAPSNNVPPPPVRPPAQKPEKRSYSKTQAGSDTVDLTDDEPPQKVITRPNMNQTVRVISPQSLMAPQRPQMSNSPRKVYIPISGAQAPNVRPGQAYMLKTINAQNVRQRVPPLRRLHPAPLPESSKQYQPPNWKEIPPAPEIKLSKVENGIVISWKLDSYQEDIHENIASYQIYAYQETQSPPSTSLWKKIGDVKALPLPMACTLTQFVSGYKYYFAVRAVDVRSRQGNFSIPGNIMLLNK